MYIRSIARTVQGEEVDKATLIVANRVQPACNNVSKVGLGLPLLSLWDLLHTHYVEF